MRGMEAARNGGPSRDPRLAAEETHPSAERGGGAGKTASRLGMEVAGKDPRVQGVGAFSFLPKPASKFSKPWRTPKYFILLGAGS